MPHPLQRHFITFHEKIKLNRFNENATLREKRDIVLDKLKENLKKAWEDKDEAAPTFDTRNQGSYEMGTGVVPLNDDFDIDVAVIFNVAVDDHPDPVEVKTWVLDALDGHTKDVRMKRPCVTVQYQKSEEPIFHVDLAVYSDGTLNPDTKTRIAMGKLNSSKESKEWVPSDPVALCKEVAERFDGDEAAQFRRVIRYLKRWKDFKFKSQGNSAPVGIGLTMAAYHWFIPAYEIVDSFSGKTDYIDIRALSDLVTQMLSNFVPTKWTDEGPVERLEAKLPIEPWDDPFSRMTDTHMTTFKDKLQDLADTLKVATEEVDPAEACAALAKVFGEDFPIPEKEETAKVSEAAVLSSSDSA